VVNQIKFRKINYITIVCSQLRGCCAISEFSEFLGGILEISASCLEIPQRLKHILFFFSVDIKK